MASGLIRPLGGLSAADKETAKQWMVEGHSLMNGKIQGGIPARGAATITPGTAAQTIPAGVYLEGAQTVAGSANLVPGNIRRGVNIFGVTGSAKMHSFVPSQSHPDWLTYKVELASVYSGYGSLTMDDIAFGAQSIHSTWQDSEIHVTSKSYNAASGTLTIMIDGSYRNITCTWTVFLYY